MLDAEGGVHTNFGVEECWDQPDSPIPKLKHSEDVKKQCFLTETGTDEDVAKFLIKKATSGNTGNSSEAAELQAAQLAQLTWMHKVIQESFVFAVEMVFAPSLD